MVKTSSKNKDILQSLNSLLSRIDTKVWIGQVTQRVQRSVVLSLKLDIGSESVYGNISKNVCNSSFFSVSDGNINEIEMYEILKRNI
jgi:hypothetical protein